MSLITNIENRKVYVKANPDEFKNPGEEWLAQVKHDLNNQAFADGIGVLTGITTSVFQTTNFFEDLDSDDDETGYKTPKIKKLETQQKEIFSKYNVENGTEADNILNTQYESLTSTQNELTQVNSKVTELTNQKKSADERVTNLNSEIKELSSQIETNTTLLTAAKEKLTAAKSAQPVNQTAIQTAEAEVRNIEKEIKQLQEQKTSKEQELANDAKPAQEKVNNELSETKNQQDTLTEKIKELNDGYKQMQNDFQQAAVLQREINKECGNDTEDKKAEVKAMREAADDFRNTFSAASVAEGKYSEDCIKAAQKLKDTYQNTTVKTELINQLYEIYNQDVEAVLNNDTKRAGYKDRLSTWGESQRKTTFGLV